MTLHTADTAGVASVSATKRGCCIKKDPKLGLKSIFCPKKRLKRAPPLFQEILQIPIQLTATKRPQKMALRPFFTSDFLRTISPAKAYPGDTSRTLDQSTRL